jgi:uncharacterized membrane protein YgaE (UPF0421/DUF939 family)
MTEILTFTEHLIDKVGPLVVFLVALVAVGLYVAYRVSLWFKPLAERLVNAHLNFVETTAGLLPTIDKKVEQHARQSDEHAEHLQAHTQKLHEIHTYAREIHQTIVKS